ncbi:MAG TPA: DUF4185 domain-containing protein, partial [Longimicrobiales bacterium]|nr:DUF4185 domain-containing protein [Longimicrobiales bacterium]
MLLGTGAAAAAAQAMGGDADVPAPSADSVAAAPVAPSVPGEEYTPVEASDTRLLGQITGSDSVNGTAERWGVHGTDLGHMFWHRGHLYMVFGDTFGKGGRGGRNWRSNTLARLADPDPDRDVLRIESMVTGPGGLARELIPSRKVDGIEKTVIPTNGVSTGDRMILQYMSVRRW